MTTLKYAKANVKALPLTKGSQYAAGYDLKAIENVTILPGGRYLADTGIIVELPEGCYGRIAPRSGLAAKKGLQIGAGVIDRDYRGTIKVVLINYTQMPIIINYGEACAQLILEKCIYADTECVDYKDLSDTDRGTRGCGKNE